MQWWVLVLQWHDVFVICSRCRGIIRFGTSISEDPRTSLRESLCFEEAEDSWGVARLGFAVTCASCEFFSFMWALISLISPPILVRLTELRARNIIQISILGPGRQRQQETLHRDTCCAEARKLGRKSQSKKWMRGLVSLTWPCEDGEDERCNRFNGQSWNSY